MFFVSTLLRFVFSFFPFSGLLYISPRIPFFHATSHVVWLKHPNILHVVFGKMFRALYEIYFVKKRDSSQKPPTTVCGIANIPPMSFPRTKTLFPRQTEREKVGNTWASQGVIHGMNYPASMIRGVLSTLSQTCSRDDRERHLRSKIRWFTEFCNSHYVSQLAAFFIDARAKRSAVKSCHIFWNDLQEWIFFFKNFFPPKVSGFSEIIDFVLGLIKKTDSLDGISICNFTFSGKEGDGWRSPNESLPFQERNEWDVSEEKVGDGSCGKHHDAKL